MQCHLSSWDVQMISDEGGKLTSEKILLLQDGAGGAGLWSVLFGFFLSDCKIGFAAEFIAKASCGLMQAAMQKL